MTRQRTPLMKRDFSLPTSREGFQLLMEEAGETGETGSGGRATGNVTEAVWFPRGMSDFNLWPVTAG